MSNLETMKSINELAAWLCERLYESEPRLPVMRHVIETKNGLTAALRSDKIIMLQSMYYGEILSSIFGAHAPEDADQCGVALLKMIGEMTEVASHYRVDRAPIVRVVEMMLHSYQGEWMNAQEGADGVTMDYHAGDWLHFKRRMGEWRIVSTPAFERRYGFRVDVRAASRPRGPIDVWVLEDLQERYSF